MNSTRAAAQQRVGANVIRFDKPGYINPGPDDPYRCTVRWSAFHNAGTGIDPNSPQAQMERTGRMAEIRRGMRRTTDEMPHPFGDEHGNAKEVGDYVDGMTGRQRKLDNILDALSIVLWPVNARRPGHPETIGNLRFHLDNHPLRPWVGVEGYDVNRLLATGDVLINSEYDPNLYSGVPVRQDELNYVAITVLRAMGIETYAAYAVGGYHEGRGSYRHPGFAVFTKKGDVGVSSLDRGPLIVDPSTMDRGDLRALINSVLILDDVAALSMLYLGLVEDCAIVSNAKTRRMIEDEFRRNRAGDLVENMRRGQVQAQLRFDMLRYPDIGVPVLGRGYHAIVDAYEVFLSNGGDPEDITAVSQMVIDALHKIGMDDLTQRIALGRAGFPVSPELLLRLEVGHRVLGDNYTRLLDAYLTWRDGEGKQEIDYLISLMVGSMSDATVAWVDNPARDDTYWAARSVMTAVDQKLFVNALKAGEAEVVSEAGG